MLNESNLVSSQECHLQGQRGITCSRRVFIYFMLTNKPAKNFSNAWNVCKSHKQFSCRATAWLTGCIELSDSSTLCNIDIIVSVFSSMPWWYVSNALPSNHCRLLTKGVPPRRHLGNTSSNSTKSAQTSSIGIWSSRNALNLATPTTMIKC